MYRFMTHDVRGNGWGGIRGQSTGDAEDGRGHEEGKKE